MTSTAQSLRAFLDAAPSAALVEVVEAKGSTPRETGAWMLVSPGAIFGTIGGGQLEFMAIDKARKMLGAASSLPLEGRVDPRSGSGWGQPGSARHQPAPLATEGSAAAGRDAIPSAASTEPTPTGVAGRPSPQGGSSKLALSIPLGPEIGQCCGGRVELSIAPVHQATRDGLLQRAAQDDAARPHVYLFGGGHVGHALAAALALLPVSAVVVETRADALADMPQGVTTMLTAVPEEAVRDAPAGSAFVVLTHDHALDFLIVAEALRRDDAAYVGMIGSKTKRATFRSWYLKEAGGNDDALARLVCPIGGADVKDKRPAVIAALASAEILRAVLRSRPR